MAIEDGWSSIGQRVLHTRVLAGYSQKYLAELCDVDPSYISHIEAGRRAITKRDLLYKLAKALRVSVHELTGEPVSLRSVDDLATRAGAEAVRQVLFLPEPPAELRPLSVLAGVSDEAMHARMQSDFHGIGRHLPGLLAEATVHAETGDERALALVVQACVTGALAFKPAGWPDLAIMLAQRAQAAAAQLGDPVHTAAAQFAVAQCALAVGNQQRSLTIAAYAADQVETAASARGVRLSDALTWATMLRLHAALSAASLHLADEADEHVRHAQDAAERVEGNPFRMEATTANVGVWRVGVALENGTPEQAPALARQVDPTKLISKQRQARLEIEKGRANFLAGKHDAATVAFLRADEIAQNELRTRISVREIVAQMVTTAPRGSSSALLDLARRTGVTVELGMAAA